MVLPLHQAKLSLQHDALIELLASHQNLLIIQDLDGVCMQLVKDPLTRSISQDYLKATLGFAHHFFVLTNGEHIGSRGVNRIIDQTMGEASSQYYLPGLAAGGVQWQSMEGKVSHPGVREEVLSFLARIPQEMATHINHFFADQEHAIASDILAACIQAAILDNKVSPTVNLNVFYDALGDRPEVYAALQQSIANLTQQLLEDARTQGLERDFFVHYAPNLGQNQDGNEVIQMATGGDSGTTDFQFMLKGARKEVGLLFLLNQYYGHHTGTFPLGDDFHVLDAPQSHSDLLALVQSKFSPESMPLMVGVGDTVTSQGQMIDGTLKFLRGGSDRGFLQLIQMIGEAYQMGNLTVYVDSSGGEVKNRKPLTLSTNSKEAVVLEGPTDPRDKHDPLRLNIAIPGGYQSYIQIFRQAASQRTPGV